MRAKQSMPLLRNRAVAFTLVELLVVIAVIGLLAALVLPALAKTRGRADAIACLNNVRQLSLAWVLYANDHRDRLAYNLGGNAKAKTVAPRDPMNWVNGVMSWELDADNTNYALILESSLAPFCQNNVQLYKCPADRALHEIQRQAGWKERTRSYSMNAMVGNAGDLSATGTNVNNPDYKQFFSFAEIPRPASIFVFMDEHPDSINDGYFLVKREYNPTNRYASMTNFWWDLPGSPHGNGAAISFADGHVEMHKWTDAATYAPPQPDAVNLPLEIPSGQRTDFSWLLRRSSVGH